MAQLRDRPCGVQGIALGRPFADASLLVGVPIAKEREVTMGDKSPKSKDRDKKQKATAKDQAKAKKDANAAAKSKK